MPVNEDLKLANLLTSLAGLLVGSQRVPAAVGGWANRMGWKEGWRRRAVSITREGARKEGRLQQVFCCRVVVRLGDWIWSRVKICSQPSCFSGWSGLTVPSEGLVELAAGIKQ